MIRVIIKHQCQYSEVVERFAAQLGVDEIQLSSPDFLGENHFSYEALVKIKEHIEAAHQKLTFIENVPWKMNYKIVYGLEGRDEQIDHYIKTIQNMGRAGIPALGFNFMPNKVWRTDWHAPARGGATASEFDGNLPMMRNQDIYAIAAMKGFEIILAVLLELPLCFCFCLGGGLAISLFAEKIEDPFAEAIVSIVGNILFTLFVTSLGI